MTKQSLKSLLGSAAGPSKALDKAISGALNVPARDYSSSVDACLDLIHEKLPSAHWHVGRGADGVSMYATMTKGHQRADASNVTVPLALLNVLIKLIQEE